MPRGDVETFHQNNLWSNQIQGEGQTGALFDKKEPAVEAGRELARQRKVEHIIKNQDGSIAERHSYGNDPRDIPG